MENGSYPPHPTHLDSRRGTHMRPRNSVCIAWYADRLMVGISVVMGLPDVDSWRQMAQCKCGWP